VQKLHKLTVIILILICMVISSGCVQQKQLEKLGLITTQGYDISGKEHDQIKGTSVVEKFDPMVGSATKVITAYAKTSKGLRQTQNLESNQKLVSGQLRSVIYGRKIAERGIVQLVDTLNRDAAIGNMVYLTIADETAEEIMKIDKNQSNVDLGTYIYNLIKQNVEGEQIISPTLHEFNHNYYDIGKDAVLPILKVKNQDVIIDGVGLFREDRLVGEIEQGKLFYLKILIDKYKAGSQEIGLDRDKIKNILLKSEPSSKKPIYSKLFITIDNIHSETKIKLVDKKNLLFKVDINLDSRLLEMTDPLDLANPVSIKVLGKEVDKAMKKNVEKLLVQFKDLGIDPIGIGNEYEAHLRGKQISREEWRKKYKNAKFDVTVRNLIERTGVID
jgi:spore germination protein